MTRKSQKRSELKHFFDFKSIIPGFPEGPITISEKPDFIIHNNGQLIGIEITRIYLDSHTLKQSTKQQDSEKILLLNKACSIYDSMHLPSVNVSVNFIPDIVFDRNKHSSLALNLAKYVSSHLPAYNGFFHFENNYDPRDAFPNEVDSIIIGRFGDSKSSFFNWPMVGWVREDCEEEIQTVINEKNVLLKQYRNCDSQWLLIVADWSSSSSFIQPSDSTLNKMYKTDFNKVFFLNCFDRAVVELRTK